MLEPLVLPLSHAIDYDGHLVDTMLSEHRDMAAAQAFFRSAKAATGVTPDWITTEGHGSYPRAIRSTLGRRVLHRTGAYKNNRLEQGPRGVQRPHTMYAGVQEASLRRAGSVEATTSSATSSAPAPATISMSQQAAVAGSTSGAPPSRSPSSRARRLNSPASSRRQVWRQC
ncbi:DDE-type integrase/transposase/recombinase [Siccirubricoccus sp. G192]|uniref:DDE-type integrase/transposase/recombinase n=1 Tax=Siccirubricoccus sp. G192 TaxID=2849651 RepID=UPI001C2C6B6D|nr:DDE-type integrase/transposase/recombinase [Siccirubricoccus sp. G192]MBV1800300.1 DDE-type integrase/transposase/recombinase [Siccirubricoccus sp. G192]